ncbi:MAG: hypothetical protein ACRENY_01145 [Candidatus Dormibacteria bacterium]
MAVSLFDGPFDGVSQGAELAVGNPVGGGGELGRRLARRAEVGDLLPHSDERFGGDHLRGAAARRAGAARPRNEAIALKEDPTKWARLIRPVAAARES